MVFDTFGCSANENGNCASFFFLFFLKGAEAKDLSNEKWEFIHLCIYCHFPFI